MRRTNLAVMIIDVSLPRFFYRFSTSALARTMIGGTTARDGSHSHSAPHKARVEAPRNPGIGRPLDDGPAIGEQSHLIGLAPELKNEFVVPDHTVRFQPLLHLNKINRPGAFVNLH